MRSKSSLLIPVAFSCALSMLLSACASEDKAGVSLRSESDGSDANVYGRVEAIQVAQLPVNNQLGMGSVIGGLIGGIIANQLGGGNGKVLATAAGIGGGAYAGDRFAQSNRPHEIYKIRVQLDSGMYQTVSQDNDTDLNVGNRVHIENGRVYRY